MTAKCVTAGSLDGTTSGNSTSGNILRESVAPKTSLAKTTNKISSLGAEGQRTTCIGGLVHFSSASIYLLALKVCNEEFTARIAK
eukprot:CAMPEP_0169182518 /NCGR_PEP_ID=MMETSP1016-20121227/100_1 /TAXON_ID=342587 /ORGANISM="Karlodinium micrum, Strain CCMP2283" /LENGTH=84 /DNA_ID=CAMNT_0009257749 /DNA_START=172 /DNA_END=423 /DNA_ORIENTATION=-